MTTKDILLFILFMTVTIVFIVSIFVENIFISIPFFLLMTITGIVILAKGDLK